MTNTRKMVTIAILSALSFVLMMVSFPLIPGAEFLKVDFSILPMLVAFILFDLKSSYGVLLLRSLLKVILANRGPETFIGLPMNMVALALFLAIFAIFWKNRESAKDFIKASLFGTVSLTVSMVALNYVFAIPLYAIFANFDIRTFIGVGNYLLTMVIPFNIVEGILISIVFYLTYVACLPILERYKKTNVISSK